MHLIVYLMMMATTYAHSSRNLTTLDYPEGMRSHMMLDVPEKPCNDFYDFTCGKWIQNQQLKPSVKLELAYDELRTRTKKVIHDIVTKANVPLVRTFYYSCMNMNPINEYSKTKPFKTDLDRVDKARSHSELFEIAGAFAQTGTHTMFQFDVKPATDQKQHLITRFAALTLPKSNDDEIEDYYDDEESLREYREYIEKIMELSGYGMISKVAANVIEIERKIGKIQREKIPMREKVPIEEAHDKWPITFGAYVKGMKITIKSCLKKLPEVVEVYEKVNMDNIEKLIKDTHIAKLKAYVAFIMIHSRIHWLGDEFLDLHFKLFGKKIEGLQKQIPREEFCIQRQLDYLPLLICSAFYKNIKEEDKIHFYLVSDLIKRVMKKHISDAEWMDESSKEVTIKKLSNVVTVLPYSNVDTERVYPFKLSQDKYAENVYTILSHSFKTKFGKIGKRVDPMETNYSPNEVYARYSRTQNKIELPVAMFQPPMFYGKAEHPALTFGAIGAIYAHQLTTLFQVGTYPNDTDGKISPWWTPLTRGNFMLGSMCIKKQFTGTVSNTIEENIGDMSGLSLAWDAYKIYLRENKQSTSVEVAEFGEKMFFVAFGQSLCSKYGDQIMKRHIRTRTADKLRVNGAIMHNPSFADVFKCADTAPMNPPEKCHIW